MKLMTKTLENTIPKLYAQQNSKNPIVYCKYFDAMGNWTWYVTEYSPEERLFFGYVVGFESEWGYFSLKEFEEINSHIPRIERDLYFDKISFKELMEKNY